MTKRALTLGLTAICAATLVAPDTYAKGISASVEGATVSGLPYRYVTMSPGPPHLPRMGAHEPKTLTVVARIEKRGGRLRRWWHLPGRYSIPAAAYDDRAGGLSADGGTLVLSRFSWIYPPRTTGLAILDTHLHLRHPRRENRARHAIRRVSLADSFSFDAISPDGSTIYLIEHLSRYYGGPYRVRALNARTGRLSPRPIVDPSEPMERMEGSPFSRVASPDGRWAYTLYSGHEKGRWDRAHDVFIHALDTVEGRAVCVELPQLEGRPTTMLLALDADGNGRKLDVLSGHAGRTLLTVDTRSFDVQRPAPVASASGGVAPGWPIAALGAAALLVLWLALRRRDGESGIPRG
jgi:hypothetical protein